MTERSTQHATFFIEREYPASPSRVFAALSKAEQKSRWFGSQDAEDKSSYSLDFRVGGREFNRGGPPGGPVYLYEAVFQDIVPDQRIIATYEMFMDDQRISISIATTELIPTTQGTKLKFTEQAVFLDGLDNAAQREEGTRMMFEGLGGYLTGEAE